MTQDKRGFFAQAFLAMMIFCAFVWAWTVVAIVVWPWEKSSIWKPEFRVVAVCADNDPCGFAYRDLADAKAKGEFKTLVLTEPAGEVMENDNWLQWKTSDGIIEAKSSSWHFQTTIRYKVEADTPVLVEYQDVGVKSFYFGIAAGLLSLLVLYWRKLTK